MSFSITEVLQEFAEAQQLGTICERRYDMQAAYVLRAEATLLRHRLYAKQTWDMRKNDKAWREKRRAYCRAYMKRKRAEKDPAFIEKQREYQRDCRRKKKLVGCS